MDDLRLQDVESKKRWLKRYKKNIACIARLEDKIRRLDDRLSLKATTYSDMPRGGLPISNEDIIADKIDLERRIKRLKEKGKIYKNEILEAIDTLEDPRHCEIMESFFIDCLTLEDIADNEGYTLRHVHRLYSEAVSLLSLTCQ